MEIDLSSHRTRYPVERVDRRVGVRAFELGNRGLADAGELCELGLGEAEVLAHPAQLQLHGELRVDRYPEQGTLAGLEGTRRTWREHALLQVGLEPQLQCFLPFVLDVAALGRENVAAMAGPGACQSGSSFLGYGWRVVHRP